MSIDGRLRDLVAKRLGGEAIVITVKEADALLAVVEAARSAVDNYFGDVAANAHMYALRDALDALGVPGGNDR